MSLMKYRIHEVAKDFKDMEKAVDESVRQMDVRPQMQKTQLEINKELSSVKKELSFKDFKNKMYIEVPGNGIVVSVPLNSVGGKRSFEYILDGQTLGSGDRKSSIFAEREKRMAVNTDFELLFVIANEGYTDLIMDAARSAGASGGTVIKAKGTGAEYTEKFFGFSIASEKEIHFIVVPAQGRNNIMKAIMEKAGLDSKAQSIVFSLPVSNAIGLWQPEQ